MSKTTTKRLRSKSGLSRLNILLSGLYLRIRRVLEGAYGIPLGIRLVLFALFMPPYLVAVWAAGTYDSLIATPWTIGWTVLWMGVGPILAIVGCFFLAVTPVLSIATVVGLIIAVPVYPQALTVLLTLIGSFFVTAPPVWITLAVLISVLAIGIYWSTGGLSW